MTRAIYVRTSTDDNDGAAQIHELAQAATARGWLHSPEQLGSPLARIQADVALFVDRGESGAKASRPGWDKLLAEVRAGRVREVMATELSRFGRSVVNVVLALDELHRLGCCVVLTRQGLDYGTPVGRAVASILAAVAQLERDQARERIKAGVRRAREQGSRSGRAVGRPRRVLDVEKARALLDDGCSAAAVARDLGVSRATLRRALEARPKP